MTLNAESPVTTPGLKDLAPGVLLCGVITLAAAGLQALELQLFGRAWLDALVLAILIGTAIRTVWSPGAPWAAGISFSARTLLEVAVVLLGATISASAVLAVGPALLVGIVLVVAVALIAGYGLGRLLGLPHRMAVLVACGNAICGNSAIAAAAPVIGADPDEVAASIGFTAVLGVVVVLALPLLSVLLGLNPTSFGVFAGLTVYAVPQVLAATAPISTLSAQTGTLVKLVRVLLLGPVVVALAVMTRRRDRTDSAKPVARDKVWHGLHRLMPWFIVGFVALLCARSLGVIPTFLLPAISTVATWMTIVAMAALGLGVDVRSVARSGARVVATVTVSLILLGALAFSLISVLHPGP